MSTSSMWDNVTYNEEGRPQVTDANGEVWTIYPQEGTPLWRIENGEGVPGFCADCTGLMLVDENGQPEPESDGSYMIRHNATCPQMQDEVTR